MEKTASAGDRAAGAQKSELDTTAHRALNFAPRQELCTVTDRMLSSWRPSDRRREAVSAVGELIHDGRESRIRTLTMAAEFALLLRDRFAATLSE